MKWLLVLGAVFLLPILVYIVSVAQMLGWLHATKQFFEQIEQEVRNGKEKKSQEESRKK